MISEFKKAGVAGEFVCVDIDADIFQLTKEKDVRFVFDIRKKRRHESPIIMPSVVLQK